MYVTWEGTVLSEAPPPDLPPPTEWQKRYWHEAEREHDRQDAGAEQHSRQVEAFAVQGIRTLALTSAGGIAAILGFYSANYERLSQTPTALSAVNGILANLFLAMLATLICCLLAYFSQVCFAAAVYSRERNWVHPYVQNTKKSKRYSVIGSIVRWFAILSVIVGAICVGAAALTFLSIVR
jgi:hypothetical protein